MNKLLFGGYMKTKMKLSAVLIIFAMSTGGCGSSPSAPARTTPAAPTTKTATVDELDIAIRDASDYLNDNIPQGNKIVILNIQSSSPDLSDYIIDELIANAVNDKVFTVVDRQQLDTIRSEQNFQLSGEVNDADALAIGKFFGAQTIVSGRVNQVGERYRMTIRALEVQTAQVQGQYNRNIAAGATITALMASGGSGAGTQSAPARTTGSGGSGTGTTGGTATGRTSPAATTNTTPTSPPITGTMVPGNSLAEKFAWLQRSAESHNTYILEVSANENIAPTTLEYKGAINVTVVLRGDNVNRTPGFQPMVQCLPFVPILPLFWITTLLFRVTMAIVLL